MTVSRTKHFEKRRATEEIHKMTIRTSVDNLPVVPLSSLRRITSPTKSDNGNALRKSLIVMHHVGLRDIDGPDRLLHKVLDNANLKLNHASTSPTTEQRHSPRRTYDDLILRHVRREVAQEDLAPGVLLRGPGASLRLVACFPGWSLSRCGMSDELRFGVVVIVYTASCGARHGDEGRKQRGGCGSRGESEGARVESSTPRRGVCADFTKLASPMFHVFGHSTHTTCSR